MQGYFNNNKKDPDRDRLRYGDSELAIQSLIYPDLQANAFLVLADGTAVAEEAYLNALNPAALGLSLKLPIGITLGRRKAAFGRTNQLHPHSWLYASQPLVLKNLVADESLTGDGISVSYLFPVKQFLQLEVGNWGLSEKPDAAVQPTGAGFRDKFTTGRLWTAREIAGGSLEVGTSYAGGKGSDFYAPSTVGIQSVDFNYRKSHGSAGRLLLRGEYLEHRQKFSDNTAKYNGFYLFADQRLDALLSYGVRYDDSQNPAELSAKHDKSATFIVTKNLTEQTLTRLELTHGDRFGIKNFNEVRLQLIFGMGPHTHNLD